MKNFIKIILCLVVIVSCLTMSYGLLKKHHEEHLYDEFKIEMKERKMEPSTILAGVLEEKDWNRFALTDNFKNKYKSKYDIIPDAKKYKHFSEGYNYIDGKRVISISSDVPKSFFDFYGVDTVTTVFYFDYKVNENNELDDINLVDIIKINTMTAKAIE